MPRKTERVHLKVTKDTKALLKRAAKRRGISLSELVRRAAKMIAFEELTEADIE